MSHKSGHWQERPQRRPIHEGAGTWADVSNVDAGAEEFRSSGWLMPSFPRAEGGEMNLVGPRSPVPVGGTWSRGGSITRRAFGPMG